ncbi:MAG TPA: glycosyltransferase [Candidatus Omnitrophica bacterium]|nr:glycosyltransferase [Candidatus Omnitrophota bacterium]
MTVSIIIATKTYDTNLKECVSNCLKLNYPNSDYEIIILPDTYFENSNFSSKVKIVPTGEITPPLKRDIGVKKAEGEILAFLDSDAYPDKDWLKGALKIFKENKNVGCVCGPQLTPSKDSLREKASGLVYSSLLVSGKYNFRYVPKKRKEVDDFPSCNFFIRRDVFFQIRGFEKPYWPGEDTFLCWKILKTGKKIIYDPNVIIFHHRRPLFKKHLLQVKNYALHRGYFVKKYPRNSFYLGYFMPSLFLLSLILGGILTFFSSLIGYFYFIGISIYLLFVFINSIFLIAREKEKYSLVNKIKLLFLVISGIILTHLYYGFYFIKGLLAKRMPEE